MSEEKVLKTSELPSGGKKTVKIGELEILLLNHQGTLIALQAKCPHAGAPLEKGAICNGRLVCPWHMATFALPSGALIEPPAMEGLKLYPVRVEGEDILVDPQPIVPQPIAPPAHKPTPKDSRIFLLAGAGAAGTMAAVTLRAQGFAGKLVLVDPVAEEPVDRTQLSKMALAGKMPLEKIRIQAPELESADKVTASVTNLSSARKQAVLSNGQTIAFDAALIATGGKPRRLDIPGAELAHTIRHAGDVRTILAAAANAKHAVILGTSFIGLEAASALVQKGLSVTVIGQEELPFAKKFGDLVAHALKALHESKGVHFRLGVQVVNIVPNSVAIRPKTTQNASISVPFDVLLMGVGVDPALSFEHDLPRAAKGGIAVSTDLRAAEGVWVAGDIANVDGTRIEHWRLAEQHGQAAARQMLGGSEDLASVPFFWTFHHGKRLGYLGHAESWDEIVYDGSVEELTFLAFYVKDGRVAAILSCGRDTDTAMLAEVMRSKPALAEARKAIAS